MKKILSLLTGGLIKDVGGVIDKLTTTDEERLAAKHKIQELLEQADKDAQAQVTDRWKADMASDSFLSKNIRPLVLIYLTIVFTVLSFFDGNIGGFQSCYAIHTYISVIINNGIRCLLCRKDLGKV